MTTRHGRGVGVWASFLAAAGAFSACSDGTSSGDPPIAPRYAAFAAAFDQERQQMGVSGASVALIEKGEVTFAHGFGTRGPHSAEAVDANTLFRIGSMTKALTATALLGLVQAGTVDLDAPLLSDAVDRHPGVRHRRDTLHAGAAADLDGQLHHHRSRRADSADVHRRRGAYVWIRTQAAVARRVSNP